MEFIIGESFIEKYNIIEDEEKCEYRFKVTSDMIIAGENRLSYLTIIKIVEAIRDVFWNKHSCGADAICKCLETRFIYPIIIDSMVQVRLLVLYWTKRTMCIGFRFLVQGRTVAHIEMELTVVDSESLEPTTISSGTIESIKKYTL